MAVISIKKHLTGDISLRGSGAPLSHRIKFNRLLRKTAAAARDCKQVWNVNSGYRSFGEQAALYRQNMNMATGRPKPGRPLTARPGTSNHEGGRAVDVSVRAAVKNRAGKVVGHKLVPVGDSPRRRKALQKHGLCLPVSGEKWHVEEGTRWVAAKP